jgi:hypothetical protein
MVTLARLLAPLLADVTPPGPLLDRLDPQRRAAVLAALAGLILLGIGLVLLVWLGGIAARRRNRVERLRTERTRAAHPPQISDWDRKQPADDNPPSPE